jgi:hypothetical protein
MRPYSTNQIAPPSVMKLLSILFLFSTLSPGCKKLPSTQMEYIDYVEDMNNQYIQSMKYGSLEFSSFYKPPSYLILQDYRDELGTNDMVLTRKNPYENWLTFTFRIRTENGQHPLDFMNKDKYDYFKKLEYYINAEKDFLLVTNNTNDTLNCQQYHMERNYGAAPYLNLNVAFSRSELKNKEFSLLYYDRVFNQDWIEFHYNDHETDELLENIL